MGKKINVLILTFVLICLMVLPINAALTNDQNAWYILVSTPQTNSTAWTQITSFPQNLVVKSGQSSPSTTNPHLLYVLFEANHIITTDDIIVIQICMQGTAAGFIIDGVGSITNASYLPGKSFIETNLKSFVNPNQTIIATTISDIGYDTKRITITFRAANFTNNYVFAKFSNLKSTQSKITLTEIDLYDTVEEAAGSGTTPEEMREVLDAWADEKLLPGIEDSVQSGVQSGMEAALEDEKQQANTDGNSAIDELTGALDGVVGDINQAKESFNTLGSALQYSGTSASLTFPAMNVPFLGQISEPVEFDMTGYIDSTFPPQLLLLIRCALSIGIVSYPIFELVRQLRKLLDKG